MYKKRNDCIAISILNVENIECFLDDICKIKKELKSNFDIVIHFDVMDGKFVKNNGVYLPYIKKVKERGLFADVHLMVEDPINDRFIDDAIDYGADNVIIHYEIDNLKKALDYLNEKKESLKMNKDIFVGVAIKPNTSIDSLSEFKNKFDNILVMSVEPGFGGQKYIEMTNEKLRNIMKKYDDKYIEVDGGVNIVTIKEPLKYSVNGYVIGSYITSSSDFDVMYKKIKEILELKK